MAFTKQNNPAATKKAAGSSQTTPSKQETKVETPAVTPAPETEEELNNGTPDLTQGAEPEPRVFPEVFTSINDAEEAIEFVKRNYEVPQEVGLVYVTSDCNVFYRKNASEAHTRNTKLTTYIVKWH